MDNNKIDTYVQQITDLNTDVKGYEVKSILEDVFNDGVKKSKSLNKVEQEYIEGLNIALSQPSYNCISKFQLIELNTVPGLTEKSLVPKSANEEGISFNELILRILNTACFKE